MIRIWNKPKIDIEEKYAYCMGFEFYMEDDKCVSIQFQSNEFEHKPIPENQTFEQAVNEWVENYVKQSFQPIVLPGRGCGISSDFDFGWEASTKDLLKLNPNIIIEEVQ